MLAFLVGLRRGQGVATQLPPLVVALGAAELFYKFSSFTLECLAFLATWLAADVLVHALWPAAGKSLEARLLGDTPKGA